MQHAQPSDSLLRSTTRPAYWAGDSENMAPMRAPRSVLGPFCLLVCGSLLLAGCGGGSSSTTHVNNEAETGKSMAPPPKSAFPATEGRTLEELIKDVATKKVEVKVTPSAEAFYPGANR